MKYNVLLLEALLVIIDFLSSPETKTERIAKLAELEREINSYLEKEGK
jgi:cobalamin biosynthesis Mg chelatase CobN